MWCVAHEGTPEEKHKELLLFPKLHEKLRRIVCAWKGSTGTTTLKTVMWLFVTGFLFLTLHPAFSPTERSRVSSVCTLRRKVDRIRRPVVLQVSWMEWRRCLLAQRSSQQMVRCWPCRILLLCGDEPVVQEIVYFLPVRKLKKVDFIFQKMIDLPAAVDKVLREQVNTSLTLANDQISSMLFSFSLCLEHHDGYLLSFFSKRNREGGYLRYPRHPKGSEVSL